MGILIVLVVPVLFILWDVFKRRPEEQDVLFFAKVTERKGDKLKVVGFNRALTWDESMTVPEGFDVFHPPEYPFAGMLLVQRQGGRVKIVEPTTLEYMERCGKVGELASYSESPFLCGVVQAGVLMEAKIE